MAAKATPLPEDIGKVRIPGKLLTGLYTVLSSLNNRILGEAAAQAFARKSGASAGRVNAEDIMQAAKSILPSTLTEIAESLKSCETRHARRKAS